MSASGGDRDAPCRLRIVPAGSMRRVAWKNGRGTTLEVVSDASVAVASDARIPVAYGGGDDWTWRVSIADVPQSGPFSRFPGVERHILSLLGPEHAGRSDEGMSLSIGSGPPVRVPTEGDALIFDGEAETLGVLHGQPLRDANLMVRRQIDGQIDGQIDSHIDSQLASHISGREQRGAMRLITGEVIAPVTRNHRVLAVIAIDASCRCAVAVADHGTIDLAPGDCLALVTDRRDDTLPAGSVRVSPEGQALLVEVLRRSGAPVEPLPSERRGDRAAPASAP
jgi:environmental stress-induced protein Ves